MAHIILHECLTSDLCLMQRIEAAGFRLSNEKKSGRNGNRFFDIEGPGIPESGFVVLRFDTKTKEISVKN